MKVLSTEPLREMESLVSRLPSGPYPGLAREVRCWNPGGMELSSDASAPFVNILSGWGVCAQNVLMGEHWTNPTKQYLQDLRLSINPLEILDAAILVLSIIQNRRLPTELKTVVIRVDNTNACSCINMCRALSPTIRRALRILVNI